MFKKITSICKNSLRRNKLLRTLRKAYIRILNSDILNLKATVQNHGYGSFHKDIQGNGHLIIIGKMTRLENPVFHIRGKNNSLLIGENCQIGPDCSFWMEGDNISIKIGDGSTFTRCVHINAQEDNTSVKIGTDCMLSNHITIRTSDSHPIVDMDSKERLNPAKSVEIGNLVWIAPDSKIMKGSIVEDNCIIGSNSMVSRIIPANSLAVGMPARVVKEQVTWTRDDVIFRKNN